MKRVLLVNPPTPFLAIPNAAPHLGIGYLISYVRMVFGSSVDIQYLNLETEDPDQVLLPEGYDLYGFTSVTAQYYYAKLLLKQVRQGKLGKTAIGGAHASLLSEDCLADGFDYVVKGFGEIALAGIISGKEQPGIIQGTRIDDLDTLPFPAWEDIYSAYDVSYGNKVGHMFTLRSCPWTCYYCCSPRIYGSIVRYRSIENVVSEITFLKSRYGIDTVYFFDPTLTMDRERTVRMSNELRKLNIVWTGQTRVDRVDSELLKIMKNAGCEQLSYGIEAANPELLGKGTSANLNGIAIDITHEAGMTVKSFLIGGLPTDTVESIEGQKAFLRKWRPDSWLYSTFIPFPGTAYWEKPEEYGITILCKDFRAYYPLGLNARGPVNVRTKYFDRDEILAARNDFLDYLRKELPNARVEEAIKRFPGQKEMAMKYFSGLDPKYLF